MGSTRGKLPAELREAAAIIGPYSELIVPTQEQRQQYLAKIATGASMHAAAAEVGVPFLAWGRLLATDEVFANDLEIARDVLRPMALEEIAVQQSTIGVDEVLTHQGQISYEFTGEYEFDENGVARPVEGSERKPITIKKLVTSNPMLLALLKANNPDKFRERTDVHMHDPLPESDDVSEKITSQADRSKLIALLSKRLAARGEPENTDPDEDLL